MTADALRVCTETSGDNLPSAMASQLLAERFPSVLSDVEGKAESMYFHLVSRAECVNELNGLRFLNEPDTVAASFVLGAAKRDWVLVGRAEPGDESEQRSTFARLAVELARHMRTRTDDRAVNRREVPASVIGRRSASSNDGREETGLYALAAAEVIERPWPGRATPPEDPADAVIASIEAKRLFVYLRKTLRSEAQRRFVAQLESHPELWDSLAAHGELKVIAEACGLSHDNVRALLSRMRAELKHSDFDDAA